MNDPVRQRDIQRTTTTVAFFVVVTGLAFFATTGSVVRQGGGFPGGPYKVYEHGWPIPFGERFTGGDSNRFALWSGDLSYSWPTAIGDVAIAAGIAYTIAVLLGACASMKWQPIVLTVVLALLLPAILTLQVQSTVEHCRDDIAAGERLQEAGYLIEWKYVGPTWWERMTGGQDELRYEMMPVEVIGIEYLEPAEVEKTIATLVNELPHFTILTHIWLWDGTRIENTGEDSEPRLRMAIAAALAREANEK